MDLNTTNSGLNTTKLDINVAHPRHGKPFQSNIWRFLYRGQPYAIGELQYKIEGSPMRQKNILVWLLYKLASLSVPKNRPWGSCRPVCSICRV